MRSLVFIFAVALSGCMLFFDGGKRPDQCDLAAQEDDRLDSVPAPLRNPENLLCQSFGGGCDPDCGPCPDVATLQPIPTWGICGSPCDSLDETTCAARSDCRVARDAKCAVAGNCVTDFLGCFPIDGAPDASIDCNRASDGWSCSRSAECSALHAPEEPCGADGQCARPFALCIAEGADPGRCNENAICDIPTPACPPNTKPGVHNGCYSGVCIPLALCES